MLRKINSLLEIRKNYKQFKKKRKGVYHYHIRKTGGTSLNKAFIECLTNLSSDVGYDNLMKEKDLRLITNNSVIVAHNKFLLELGNYNFGFSHLPHHQLNLPENIQTFTILRDPVKRIVSHYKMLSSYNQSQNRFREDYEVEVKWLGRNIYDFVNNIPRKHKERQLYMFSKNFNANEGIENIKKLDLVLFLEDFAKGVKNLGQMIDKEIPLYHKRKSSVQIQYSHKDIQNGMKEEIKFYNKVKTLFQ